MKSKIIIIFIALIFVILILLLTCPSLFGLISAQITDICIDENTTKDFTEGNPSYVITDVENTLSCNKTDKEYFLKNIGDYIVYDLNFDVKNYSQYYIVFDNIELKHNYGTSVILSTAPMISYTYCEPYTTSSCFSIEIYIDTNTYSQTEINKLLSEIEICFCYKSYLSESSISMGSYIGKNKILLMH